MFVTKLERHSIITFGPGNQYFSETLDDNVGPLRLLCFVGTILSEELGCMNDKTSVLSAENTEVTISDIKQRTKKIIFFYQTGNIKF